MADHPIALFSWICCFCGTANDPAATTTTTSLSTLETIPHALQCRLCAKPPCPACNVSADSLGPPPTSPTRPTTLHMKLAPPALFADVFAHGYICPYCGAANVLSDAAALLERAVHGVAALAPAAQAATQFARHGHRRWHLLEPVLPRCARCARRVMRPGQRLDFWLVARAAGSEAWGRRVQDAVARWWGVDAAAAAAAKRQAAESTVAPALGQRLLCGTGVWDAWRTACENGKAANAAGLLLLVVCAAAA